jgi:hypothetical protein
MTSARVGGFGRVFLIAIVASTILRAAELKPETTAAFDRYVKVAEDDMDKHKGFRDFLWLDRQEPKEKSIVWLGQSTVVPLTTLDNGQEIEVPDGTIQHWLGLTFLEKATLDKVSVVLLNFNEYFHMIPLQIIESKTSKHEGDNYEGFLRLYKKQVSAVVLNVNETAKYTQIDPMRALIACHSTHIGEVERPRKKKTYDQERDAEDAAGYLWRLNVYLRMEEADNGVYVEIEMITLARPSGGILDKSRYLNGFQSFPKELVQGYIAALEYIYPRRK